MATNGPNPDRVAEALATAAVQGDAAAAARHDVAKRTLRYWRKRVEREPALAELVRQKRAALERDWIAEVPATMRAAVRAIRATAEAQIAVTEQIADHRAAAKYVAQRVADADRVDAAQLLVELTRSSAAMAESVTALAALNSSITDSVATLNDGQIAHRVLDVRIAGQARAPGAQPLQVVAGGKAAAR